MNSSNASLSRVLGFWAVVAYGVGDILGAGIYALVGEIALRAGEASVLAFAVALAIAGLTALSYGELVRRFPTSGGEAKFCEEGFRSSAVALFVGWLVLCSGIVSMAAVSLAFAGYFGELLPHRPSGWLAEHLLPAGFLVLLGVINFWGMRQSSATNIFCTVVEVSGLLFVIGSGLWFLYGGESTGSAAVSSGEVPVGWGMTLQASGLAFFAFIGFEDLVKVAEETSRPRRTIPAALLTSVVIAGTVYILVVWVATSVVPPAELGRSEAPLLDVVQRALPDFPGAIFVVVALIAVSNTALINFITASRLLYGMAGQRLLPRWLRAVNPMTRTPGRAILVVLMVGILLAWSGTLAFLAGTTSALILLTFAAVNGALIAVKRREKAALNRGFRVPMKIPVLGLLSCLALITFLEMESLLRALVVAVLGLLLVVARAVLLWRRGARETDQH